MSPPFDTPQLHTWAKSMSSFAWPDPWQDLVGSVTPSEAPVEHVAEGYDLQAAHHHDALQDPAQLLGNVTPSKRWLNKQPNLNVHRLSGSGTPSKLWLGMRPE